MSTHFTYLNYETIPDPSAQYHGFESQVKWGEHLVLIGGCNDCHTPGAMEKGPAVPEKDWLTGVPVGSTDGEGWNGVFHPDDQERAWQARKSGTVLPIEVILDRVLRDYPGEILEIDFDDDDDEE